jgi:hypothetical protein
LGDEGGYLPPRLPLFVDRVNADVDGAAVLLGEETILMGQHFPPTKTPKLFGHLSLYQ